MNLDSVPPKAEVRRGSLTVMEMDRVVAVAEAEAVKLWSSACCVCVPRRQIKEPLRHGFYPSYVNVHSLVDGDI